MSSMILGISHLVVSSQNIDATVAGLSRQGYTINGARDDMPNMEPKQAFISNDMPRTTTVRLLVSNGKSPAVEVVRENGPDNQELAVGTPPFSAADKPATDPHIVTVRTPDPLLSLSMWRTIGIQPTEAADGTNNIFFQGGFTTPAFQLSFIHDPEMVAGPRWLNQDGMVCVSFLCRDVDALNTLLEDKGYEVSPCFDLTPFDRSFRLFFVRNKSGEIYEFLTPRRSAAPARVNHD